MKGKAAIVIAALMITSMAFAMSTTVISAAHEPTVSIDQSRVKFSASTILTITVQNAGPGLIDNVTIIVPPELTEFYPLVKIFKDNLARLDNGWANDNVVTLPAGTLITLTGTLTDAIVPENTIVIRKSGENVFSSATGKWYILSENASLKLVGSTTTDNLTINTDNATLPAALPSIMLDNGQVRLVSDTQVISLGSGVVKLPANTLVYLTTVSTENIPDNTVTLVAAKPVTLDNVDNAKPTTTASVSAKRESVEAVTISAGVLLTLPAPNENVVVLPAGTQVKLPNGAQGTVPVKTQVIRGVYENMLTVSGAENTSTDNQPTKWAQSKIDATTVQWTGTADNIASGESLGFPFAIQTPTAAGTYTIYVRTKEIGGSTFVQKSVTLTVDNSKPTVTVAASPTLVKANTAVTITVTASETLAKLDNVLVRENNAPENTKITMTSSADNKVWTGTYTTGDNASRDGSATIYVKDFEDLVGYKGDLYTSTPFKVDRMAPPKPNIKLDITGWPKTPTNTGAYVIGGTAYDNYLGSSVVLKEGKVRVRVGTAVYENTTDALGYWSQAIALTESVQEVGIRYVDVAGNLGAENVENITYDKTKPSITPGTIAGKALADGVRINIKKPTVTLTISDAVMGVENRAYDNNKGYSVVILYENKENIENLTNTLAHNRNTLQFQGAPTADLADGTYYVYVVAGDNLQKDNKLVKFVVDTLKPTMPTLTPVNNPVLYGTTAAEPKMQRTITLIFYGSDVEALSTLTIYLVDQSTGQVLSTVTTTADSAGNFNRSLTLVGGKTVRIEVETTDVAGNTSTPKIIYGYVMADATAPIVTLATPPATTDAASIAISGTVTKDAWESYSDITLTVQVGTASMTVPVGADGSYTYSVALSMGPNTIVVRATDPMGNMSSPATATVTRVTTLDTSAPTVTLGTLLTTTTATSVTVTGTVTKDPTESYSDITLTLQVGTASVSVPINTDGSFSYNVPLSIGANTIVVRAVDRAGNASTRSATIERTTPVVTPDTSAPAVTLGTLPESTDAASILITGTVGKDAAESYSDITVKVQGGGLTSAVEMHPGTNGSFSASVVLVEGSNTITVQAFDKVGNASTATATITRAVTPWATYAIVIVIITLVLAAIAIFRKK